MRDSWDVQQQIRRSAASGMDGDSIAERLLRENIAQFDLLAGQFHQRLGRVASHVEPHALAAGSERRMRHG